MWGPLVDHGALRTHGGLCGAIQDCGGTILGTAEVHGVWEVPKGHVQQDGLWRMCHAIPRGQWRQAWGTLPMSTELHSPLASMGAPRATCHPITGVPPAAPGSPWGGRAARTPGSHRVQLPHAPQHPREARGAPQCGVPLLQVLSGGFPGQEQGHALPGLQAAPLQQVGDTGDIAGGLVAQLWGGSGVASTMSTLSPARTPCYVPCGPMGSRASPRSPSAR